MDGNTTNNANNTNIFEESSANPAGLKDRLLGPDYPYYKYIKAPDKLGMSGAGSLSQLGKNINGLMSYTELLVEGTGKASATGKPLGNKFFLKTGAKCSPINGAPINETNADENKKEEDRYIYINNVPQGNIPFISSGMGTNFKEMRGLIPGTISDLNAFNPMTILSGFTEGSTPNCDLLTMETIDTYNNRSTESHYVTLTDINNMDPCSFINKKNPQSGTKCKEGFTGSTSIIFDSTTIPILSHNYWTNQLYFIMVGVFSIYIIKRLCEK